MYRVFKTEKGYKARLVGTISFDPSAFFECDNWPEFQRELQYRINNEYHETQKEITEVLQKEIRETVAGEKSDTSQSEIPFIDRRKEK